MKCRWGYWGFKSAYCVAPQSFEFEPVFGTKPKKENSDPRKYRDDPEMCGPDGKWFQPRFLARVFGV